MLRRPIIRLSYNHRSVGRLRPRVRYEQGPQLSHFLRHEFYSSTPGKAPGEAATKSGSGKILLGSVLVAGGGLLAYQYGYVDQFLKQKDTFPIKNEDVGFRNQGREVIEPVETAIAVGAIKNLDNDKKTNAETVDTVVNDHLHVDIGEKIDIQTDSSEKKDTEAAKFREVESTLEEQVNAPETEVSLSGENPPVALQDNASKAGGILETKDYNNSLQSGLDDGPDEIHLDSVPSPEPVLDQALTDHDKDSQNLMEKYLLGEIVEVPGPGYPHEEVSNSVETVTGDGNIIVDFLQAIHVAEERQAKLDALAFAEEKRVLKEKYEKELRELRARELMRAEEVAMLDKEIKREKSKAASAIISLHEKMKEKLRIELEQKDSETEAKLKAVQELAKAELTAAIAKEKATQIEEMADANLNIKALCMAFFARSEETRQIHSVHKLALGALVIEDALAKGLPIQHELDALNAQIQELGQDSLLRLVFSSLPEETKNHGTDTLLQLNSKFNSLKDSLRKNILLPPGGGGMWGYTLGQISSWLRLKNVDPRGEGIESTICRVENLLAEGKVIEAADALIEGVKGSQAEELIGDWVKSARNRAIAEQALTILQSYATSVSLAN